MNGDAFAQSRMVVALGITLQPGETIAYGFLFHISADKKRAS